MGAVGVTEGCVLVGVACGVVPEAFGVVCALGVVGGADFCLGTCDEACEGVCETTVAEGVLLWVVAVVC